MAVTVVLALIVKLQVTVVDVHPPLHEEKAFPPDVVGAVSVTDVPASYVRVKLVLPFATLLISAGETVIATPLAGVAEFTVSTYVVVGGVVVLLPPPPQAVINRLSPIPIQSAARRLKSVMPMLPVSSISSHCPASFPGCSHARVPLGMNSRLRQ